MEFQQIRKAPKVQTTSMVLLILGIIFVASNLRAPLTSVGPLISLIRDDLAISNTLAGLITTLPLLAFAFFSPFVPRLARKTGLEMIIFISAISLTLGIVLRSQSSVISLYTGTAVIGLAIAVSNVLLPSLMKREFPKRVGFMTGVYSISMNINGAIASGISIPMAVGLGYGWQGSLGVWGILSFIAIFIWIPQIRGKNKLNSVEQNKSSSEVNHKSVWHSPLAWQVTLFMGLQSMVFYVLIAWLPEILSGQGISADESGFLLSIMQLGLLPFTFIVPIIAGRLKDQKLLIVMTVLLLMTGILGLIYGSTIFMIGWILIVGMGIGFAFGLSMMFFPLRTKNAEQAAELSGMAQSVGYLLAAVGPTLFGYIYDLTNSWTIPLFILLGITCIIFMVGLGAARNQTV